MGARGKFEGWVTFFWSGLLENGTNGRKGILGRGKGS